MMPLPFLMFVCCISLFFAEATQAAAPLPQTVFEAYISSLPTKHSPVQFDDDEDMPDGDFEMPDGDEDEDDEEDDEEEIEDADEEIFEDNDDILIPADDDEAPPPVKAEPPVPLQELEAEEEEMLEERPTRQIAGEREQDSSEGDQRRPDEADSDFDDDEYYSDEPAYQESRRKRATQRETETLRLVPEEPDEAGLSPLTMGLIAGGSGVAGILVLGLIGGGVIAGGVILGFWELPFLLSPTNEGSITVSPH